MEKERLPPANAIPRSLPLDAEQRPEGEDADAEQRRRDEERLERTLESSYGD